MVGVLPRVYMTTDGSDQSHLMSHGKLVSRNSLTSSSLNGSSQFSYVDLWIVVKNARVRRKSGTGVVANPWIGDESIAVSSDTLVVTRNVEDTWQVPGRIRKTGQEPCSPSSAGMSTASAGLWEKSPRHQRVFRHCTLSGWFPSTEGGEVFEFLRKPLAPDGARGRGVSR